MKTFILNIPTGLPSVIMVGIVLFFSLSRDPLGLSRFYDVPFAEAFGHLVLYFFLALVLIMDYAKARLPHHSKYDAEAGFAASAATFALIMEMAQLYIGDGTNFDFTNWIAACIGALLAFLFFRLWLLHPFRHYLYHTMQHHWRYARRKK